MYQIGDIVVYGTEGIAEIGEEIEREFDGQKLHKCREVYRNLWAKGRSVLQLTVAA